MSFQAGAKNAHEVIYLDPGFITEAYERMTGEEVPVQVTKSSDFSGEVSGWIVKAGATTTVERQYPVSISKMYNQLLTKLEGFPRVRWCNGKRGRWPELFWVEGSFGLSRSELRTGDRQLGWSSYYSFCPSLEAEKRLDMPLATNDAYFSSGYDQLSRHALSMACAFAIRARLLVKLLYIDANYPVGALMVGIKKGYTNKWQQ